MLDRKFSPFLRSVVVFLAIILLIKLVSHCTSLAIHTLTPLGRIMSKQLSAFSSLFSFSLGDVFYTILALGGVFFLGVCIRLLIQRNYKDLGKKLSYLFNFLSIFYLFFYLVWGFNYYKTPIKDAYDVELDSLDELKQLADMYYLRAKMYREQVQEDERGVFKMGLNQAQIKQEFEKSAWIVKEKYPEIEFVNQIKTNLKPSLYSEIFSHLGVLGYYNPFTSESQYNVKMPDSKLLFTELHESAHQFGFATESEANFVGFVIGIESTSAEIQYASNFKAMRSILNRILWLDPIYVKSYVELRYSEGMKRDREYEMEINEKYTGKSGDAFSLMNEAFLKMNNQEGLESYGRFVELLVGFNRKYQNLE